MKKVYFNHFAENFSLKSLAKILFVVLICCFFNRESFAQSMQTLPFPSNNNQASYASTGGTFGPMATTNVANQYSRYAYVYPQSLIGTPNADATGSLVVGNIITSLEFNRGFNNTVTMNATGTLRIYLVNLSAATTNWGATTLNWTTQAAASTLVYNANPAALINAGAKPGNVNFPITNFTYTGGALGVLVEYTQTTAQTAEISWGYENSSTITDYVNNSALGIVGTGAASNTLGAVGGQSLRHPTLKVNYTSNDNCANAATVTPGLSCTPTSGSNVNATASSGNPTQSCGVTGVSNDVWYSFTADGVSPYTINLTPASGRWSIVVYNGACGSLTTASCT
jgi:hypothetical protein